MRCNLFVEKRKVKLISWVRIFVEYYLELSFAHDKYIFIIDNNDR